MGDHDLTLEFGLEQVVPTARRLDARILASQFWLVAKPSEPM
jgi:hypothetical protein